jgi:carbon storage regulator
LIAGTVELGVKSNFERNLIMLVLTRRENEQICVGNMITITVVRLEGDKVRIGIEAPDDVPIDRAEIAEAKKKGYIYSGKNKNNGSGRHVKNFTRHPLNR